MISVHLILVIYETCEGRPAGLGWKYAHVKYASNVQSHDQRKAKKSYTNEKINMKQDEKKERELTNAKGARTFFYSHSAVRCAKF